MNSGNMEHDMKHEMKWCLLDIIGCFHVQYMIYIAPSGAKLLKAGISVVRK